VYLGSFVAIGFLSPHIRRACRSMAEGASGSEGEALSVPGLLARKYGKVSWSLILLAYGIVYIGFLGAQYAAIALVLQAMGLTVGSVPVVIVSALAVFLYVSLAGFRAVVSSDIIQLSLTAVIFVVGLILVFLHGTPEFRSVAPVYWNPFLSKEMTSTFVWLAVFIFPTLLLRLDHWQRIVAAESDRTAFRAYVTAGGLLALVFGVLLWVGAGSIGGESPFFLYREYLLGEGGWWREIAYGLALCGFLAAIVSSADTILNSAASAISQAFRGWGLRGSERISTLIGISFALTGLSTVLAIAKPDVVTLITEGFKAMTILLPAVAAAILLRNPHRIAAGASVVGGFVAYILVVVMWGRAQQWAYVVGFVVALVCMVGVSSVDRRSRSEVSG